MTDNKHYYFASGLWIACDRPMPGLRELAPPAGGEPDVVVEFGDVPVDVLDADALGDEFYVHANGDVSFAWASGRGLISGGRSIRFDLDAAELDASFSSMVFVLVLAIVLHQRRTLPMHCCCVADGDGALMLFGDSGAGKSTTALMFADRGWRILAEDMVALDFPADGPITAVPSAGLARFWSESWDGVRPEAFGERMELKRFPKAVISFGEGESKAPVPVRAIYNLAWLHPVSAPTEVERLNPMQSLAYLRASVYRGGLADQLGLQQDYLRKLSRLAATTPAFVLRRPRSFENMDWLDRLTNWSDIA